MIHKRTLLIAWFCSGALLPGTAAEWEAIPPLPPLPTASWTIETEETSGDLANHSSTAGLEWELVPEPSGMGQRLAIAWETVPNDEVIDPEAAVAADLDRVKAYQQAIDVVNNPFRPLIYTPYLAGFQPSAYINQWGEGWIGGFGATADNFRDGTVDATLNMRLGLGDPDKWLAIQAGWDIASYRNLNANGSFDLRIARVLYESRQWQITAGGGLLEIGRYGNETGRVDTNGYGVVTFATPLRHQQTDFSQLLQFSLGVGGNRFAPVPEGEFLPTDTMGYFLAVGMQVTPNIGISLGRSGRGANAVLSWLPDNEFPLYLEAAAVDLFDESAGGRVAVFSVRIGGRNLYRPRNQSTTPASSNATTTDRPPEGDDHKTAPTNHRKFPINLE